MAATFKKLTDKDYYVIDSNSVKVFPCAYRGTKVVNGAVVNIDKYAQLNTEYNLTHLPGTSLCRSYRVDPLVLEESTTAIEFVLDGYAFEISGITVDPVYGIKVAEAVGATPAVYAKYFFIKTTGTEQKDRILTDISATLQNKTLDFEDYFYGVGFSANTPDSAYYTAVVDIIEANGSFNYNLVSTETAKSIRDYMILDVEDEKLTSTLKSDKITGTDAATLDFSNATATVKKINVKNGSSATVITNKDLTGPGTGTISGYPSITGANTVTCDTLNATSVNGTLTGKLSKTLTLINNNDGSVKTTTFDGSEDQTFTATYTLPAASAQKLGGVKVDNTTIAAAENGTISVIGSGLTGNNSAAQAVADDNGNEIRATYGASLALEITGTDWGQIQLKNKADVPTVISAVGIAATNGINLSLMPGGTALYFNGQTACQHVGNTNRTQSAGTSYTYYPIVTSAAAGTHAQSYREPSIQIKTATNTAVGEIQLSSHAITGVSSLTASGTITAANFVATSDKRLKENIVDYKCEKSILDLPVKKFDFINGAKNQIGCLAQDLKEICPEIVEEKEDGYLGIQETKLVYLLLQEVKELKEEVNRLKRGE